MINLFKFCSIVRLECLSQWRGHLTSIYALSFFLVCILFFPLAIGSDPYLLQQIGPGYIWLIAMFACLLSVEPLFKIDDDSGFLEKCCTMPHSLNVYTYSKVISHWLLNGVPIILLSPLLGCFYYLPNAILCILMLSLLLGTLLLSLFATLAAALTLPASQRTLLIPLLIIPLMVPVFVLGTLSNYYMAQGYSPIGLLSLLLALLLAAMLILPFCSRYLLKYGQT